LEKSSRIQGVRFEIWPKSSRIQGVRFEILKKILEDSRVRFEKTLEGLGSSRIPLVLYVGNFPIYPTFGSDKYGVFWGNKKPGLILSLPLLARDLDRRYFYYYAIKDFNSLRKAANKTQ
jgi:hypothetical protein